jgi:hypothetical protein
MLVGQSIFEACDVNCACGGKTLTNELAKSPAEFRDGYALRLLGAQDVYIARPFNRRRPRGHTIGAPTGPIHADIVLGESSELIAQNEDASRAGSLGRYQIAGQDDEIDFVFDRGLKHICRGPIWGFDQEVAQVVGHFGQPRGRPFQMKV